MLFMPSASRIESSEKGTGWEMELEEREELRWGTKFILIGPVASWIFLGQTLRYSLSVFLDKSEKTAYFTL